VKDIDPIETHYRETAAENDATARHLTRRMNLLGLLRFGLVVGWVTVLVLMKASGIVWITAGFALPFAVLMIWHERLAARKRYAEAWGRLCRNELRGLEGDHAAFDGAAGRIDANHSFSFDLDLFGADSLFQAINRTVTPGGEERLADWLLAPLRDKQSILRRQEAVAELSRLTALRHRFQVTGSLNRGGKNDARLLQALTAHPLSFARKRFWKAMVWIVPAVWVAVTAGCFAGAIPIGVPIVLYLLNTVPAYLKFREITALQNALDRAEKVLSTTSRLISLIEEQAFESPLLAELKQQLASEENRMPASKVVRRLSRCLDALAQRSNLLVATTFNVILLRDIRIAIRLEKWKREHAADIPRWFDALAAFDALCSQGTFAYNRPEYPYPAIADRYFVLEGKGLGHPLMRPQSCVRNDVSFRAAPQFVIVTGANMAGKSTWLRTVSVNFVLACAGMPVCADELTVCPAGLATSLRTSDSLSRGESYFFAELKRLKAIIDRLRAGERLFIVLDEILRGTNSADKQKGSLALVRQLVSYGACGIIATHDLALGSLAAEFPGVVRNERFEGEIEGDRLVFSYRLQAGVAQNMNATFLMEKMGITVEAGSAPANSLNA
jgi:predicted ATPase